MNPRAEDAVRNGRGRYGEGPRRHDGEAAVLWGDEVAEVAAVAVTVVESTAEAAEVAEAVGNIWIAENLWYAAIGVGAVDATVLEAALWDPVVHQVMMREHGPKVFDWKTAVFGKEVAHVVVLVVAHVVAHVVARVVGHLVAHVLVHVPASALFPDGPALVRATASVQPARLASSDLAEVVSATMLAAMRPYRCD